MQTSLRRMWIQLTADRRRFGVLCATLGVGLLLWARLIIVSNVPRTAVADPAAAIAPRDGAKAAAPGDGASDKPSTKGGAKVAAKSREPVDIQLWSLCERDPFVISPVHFPKSSSAAVVQQDRAKLPTEPAEDESQREARRVARLRELLGSVRLEAVMGGSTAIIGGKGYRVGQPLPPLGPDRVEFMLVEVRDRSVVVESGGVRFELAMSRPGEAGN